MCGNDNCKFINIFYLTDDDEKVMIHYDSNYRPIWIQHFCKNEIQTTFIPDKYELFDTQQKYKPKIKILNEKPSVLYDF